MTTKSKTSTVNRNSFFANTQKPTGIVVPENPIYVQNDCSIAGRWVLGEKNLDGDPIEFFILAFQFGEEPNFEQTEMIRTGTIWFTPISGCLTPNLVYATKIKNMRSGRKGSLQNFGNRVAELVVQGLDPREVIWEARFVKKTGNLPNGQPFNCHVLDFDFRYSTTPEELATLDNCVVILQDANKMNLLQGQSLPAIAEATD